MKGRNVSLSGVSPVVGVILMVAITVVLSGVVFLWADSFAEDAGTEMKYINIRGEALEDINGIQMVDFTILSGTVDWKNVRILISGNEYFHSCTDECNAGDMVELTIPSDFIDWNVGDSVVFKVTDMDQFQILWTGDLIVIRA